MEEKGIEWQAPEFIYKEKHSDWFWIVGIISVSGVVVALLLSNIILAILIATAGFTATLIASRKPRIVKIGIKNNGVYIHDTLLPFDTLDVFSIEESGEFSLLHIEHVETLRAPTTLVLYDVDPDVVREKLSEYIPERPHTTDLADRTKDFMGL